VPMVLQIAFVLYAAILVSSFLGFWTEAYLSWRLHPRYFATGPMVARFCRALLPHEKAGEEGTGIPPLPHTFVTRVVSSSEVLIRRRGDLAPLGVELPSLWRTYHMRAMLKQRGDKLTQELESRHAVSWPLFILSPEVVAPYVLAQAGAWTPWTILFFSTPPLLVAVLLTLSVRAARRDAARVWEALGR